MQENVRATAYKEAPPRKKSNASREELVRESIKGNPDAIGALCQSIAKDILFRTEFLLRSRMDAEDVAQEILIRVCEKIGGLRDPKVFGVWLDRIVVNETRRFMMKNYKNNNVLDIQDYLESVEEENSNFLPQDSADRKESRRIVMGIINKLPQQQRQVLLLCFYGERSVTEAASVMGIKRSSASHSLSTAKKKIKRELELLADKTNYVLRGLAMLPGATLIREVLQEESACITPADAIWIEQALARCSEFIGVAAAAGAGIIGAGAGIAGAGAGFAGAANTGSAAASGAGAAAAPFAPVVGVMAAAVVAVTGFTASPVIDISSATQAIVEDVDYAVVFSGGDDLYEHINPVMAQAQTDSSMGALEASDWTISPVGGDAVLFSGYGGVVDEAFVYMKSTSMDGSYMLSFIMEDATGRTYLLSRGFTIDSGL